MSQIILDAEAGQVSAELARRGIPPHTRVHDWSRRLRALNSPWPRLHRPERVSTGLPRNPNSTLTPT